jgi:filamentous hemagglutinin family protein
MKKIVFSLLLYSITAYAAPEGFELISGQASPPQVDSQGQMHIQSTQDSVVHWDSFSLTPQEVLIFDQAQEASRILNRVVGSDPSEILGKIQSNGIVYLINQNGILIGPGGVIETAGFLASTLDSITQDLFAKSTLEFFSEHPGSIVNLGTISCPLGQVTLLAQNIDNQGNINGSVNAVACTQATLQIDNQRVFIQTNQQLDTPDNLQSLNISIQKNLYAHAIKHSGKISNPIIATQEGSVYLFAQKTEVTGEIEAFDIQLLGKEVLLKEQAIIDASSDTQGGNILIGGGYKGQDPQISLADHVLIESQVQIQADAKYAGNGGEIIIWSKENTEFLGNLSAKGGSLEGDGGFAEISGKQSLSFNGRVDLTAAHGKVGNLLIDPDILNITPSGTDPATGQIFPTNGTANVSGSSIAIALNSANLILQANASINILDSINSTSSNDLTLQGGSIFSLSSTPSQITLSGGNFQAVFNDEDSFNAPTDGRNSFELSNIQIRTNGGNIDIQQGNFASQYRGMIVISRGSMLDTAGGSLTCTLHPNNNDSQGQGILVADSTITAGDCILNGAGRSGIVFQSSTLTAASILATGVAKEDRLEGIILESNSTWTASTGEIVLNGQAENTNGTGISVDSSEIRALNNSVTLHCNVGSIELDDGVVSCGGDGVLMVNSPQDCRLLASFTGSTMRVNSGIANFTVGRDLVLTSGSLTGTSSATIGSENANLTGGSLQFDIGRNVSLTSNNQLNHALIGYGDLDTLSNVTGDILFNHVGGDMTLMANNGFAQIGHLSGGSGSNTLNGDISLIVDGSISVIGSSSRAASYAQIGHGSSDAPFTTTGQLTAIAGKNIIMQSNVGSANIVNAGGDITLVADNIFPVAPLIGSGFFSINSNLSASGEVRIYTAARSQNQINDLINGSPFVPGTLFVDTNEEKWAVYYPGGIYGGGPFTIYYKDGTIEAIEEVFQLSVDQAELSNIVQSFRMENTPIYQANLDYFSEREWLFFDPYRRILRYRTNLRYFIGH